MSYLYENKDFILLIEYYFVKMGREEFYDLQVSWIRWIIVVFDLGFLGCEFNFDFLDQILGYDFFLKFVGFLRIKGRICVGKGSGKEIEKEERKREER